MMEFKGPSVFEIKNFIKEKALVEFKTINDKSLKGRILWFDKDSFHLELENQKNITILKTAISYYTKVNQG